MFTQLMLGNMLISFSLVLHCRYQYEQSIFWYANKTVKHIWRRHFDSTGQTYVNKALIDSIPIDEKG